MLVLGNVIKKAINVIRQHDWTAAIGYVIGLTMTCHLKSTFKSLALISSLALLAANSLHAQSAYVQGDLIAGFSSGSGNDLVVDLGPASSLTDGKTWNLSGRLVVNLATIANDSWGVIGVTAGSYNSSTSKIYCTATGGSIGQLNPIDGKNYFIYALGDVGAFDSGSILGYSNSVPVGDGTYGYIAATDSQGGSWNQQTIAGTTGWGGDFFNPNIQGATSINCYTLTTSGTPQIGTFSLSSGGVLTFNAISAPTPPTITLNTPANSSTYAAYANIPLSATVVSNSNPITSVQFFSGASLLATVTTPPYTATWNFVAPGTYPAVSAQVVYGSGTVTSSVVSVTVNALVKPVVSAPVKNGSGFSFSFTGPNGQPYTVLTTTNVALASTNWTVVLTNVAFGVSGTASFTNVSPADPQRYYRVKSP